MGVRIDRYPLSPKLMNCCRTLCTWSRAGRRGLLAVDGDERLNSLMLTLKVRRRDNVVARCALVVVLDNDACSQMISWRVRFVPDQW